MKKFTHTFEKLRLIYSQPATYILWTLHLGFMVIYQKYNNILSIHDYCNIFLNDYYLWIIVIPLITATHRIGIYNISYYSLSRYRSIRGLIKTDMTVLIISTTFLVITGIFIPLGFIRIFEQQLWDMSFYEQAVLLSFVIIRYVLLAFFIQLIIYILYFSFIKIQRNGFVVPILPFILFPLLSLPSMLFSGNRFITEVFNYSVGIAVYGEYMSFKYVVFTNIYVFLQILLLGSLLYFLKERMEFFEYENKAAQ